MRLTIRNQGDLIRLRNLFAYKIFRNSTKINRWINYRMPEEKGDSYNLASLIDTTQIDVRFISEAVRYTGKMTMENRFDLLGSGWVKYQAFHDKSAEEKENYHCICWNLDMRMGYRWPCRYLDEAECISSPKGVDIKNVWELGRMNFLVPFSLYILTEEHNGQKAEAIRYYKNMITDFAQNNPTGIGVNWVLPMEASIRVANILVSYDLARQADKYEILDVEFSNLMKRVVYAHIKFIWNNLEKNIFGGRNGNHYYSNLAGLLIATGYLEKRNAFVKKIYKYVKEEFLIETKEQFYSEGGHFEQSTGYFRLTAEMAVFGAAILLRNGENIPEDIIKRICNNRKLALSLKKSNGSYYLFGDCDSGRFIKTGLYGNFITNEEAEKRYLNLNGYAEKYGRHGLYFLEDDSSMDSLIRYTEGLLASGGGKVSSIETQIISLLAGRTIPDIAECKSDTSYIRKDLMKTLHTEYPIKKVKELSLHLSGSETWNSNLYRQMGFYILRSSHASVFFRIGNDEGAGHGHNDTLHYEYECNGESYQEDSGTYTYTAYPEKRNLYRATPAHNVPLYGHEQREFLGLFGYCSSDKREIVEYTDDSIAVWYKNRFCNHVRRIKICNHGIMVEDYGKCNYEIERKELLNKSPAYGVIER